ncbi:hypothetical protein GHT06_012284 [Daphnia sinensis]|uniref:Uncharacterized protein n=1 Tax=Daphnia sinensis TaxID=1820382 RepID=A0AAD5PX26_9CRUS|nr:hypothetical protein GHT06_012284 [Daphnia sinensis]
MMSDEMQKVHRASSLTSIGHSFPTSTLSRKCVLLVTICAALYSRVDADPVDNDEQASMTVKGILSELQEELDKGPCDPRRFNACFARCVHTVPLHRCKDYCLLNAC